MIPARLSQFPRLEIVGVAKDGLEAIELIRGLKPDLVTLDIRMPKMSGIEVLKALKAEGLEITVIVLSALTTEEARKKCLELGARHVFDKTLEFEKFTDVLADL